MTVFALPALAIMPPPAKLLDSKLAPACVKARASLMAGGENAPAVSLIDKCNDNITVSGLSERDTKTPEKPVDDVGLVLATRASGYVQYIDLRLKKEGADCFADKPPEKAEGFVCKSVTLRPADALIVPVAWGMHYNIMGTAGEKTPLQASGWVINAKDPAQAMDIITKESGVPAMKTGVTPPQ